MNCNLGVFCPNCMYLAVLEKVPRGPQGDRGPQFGNHCTRLSDFYVNTPAFLHWLSPGCRERRATADTLHDGGSCQVRAGPLQTPPLLDGQESAPLRPGLSLPRRPQTAALPVPALLPGALAPGALLPDAARAVAHSDTAVEVGGCSPEGIDSPRAI